MLQARTGAPLLEFLTVTLPAPTAQSNCPKTLNSDKSEPLEKSIETFVQKTV